MANTPLTNTYHHRLVAASASKPCFICYKPSASVLITPDSRDFFYICAGHLVDRGFCTPVSNGPGCPPAPATPTPDSKRQAALDIEIARVVAEYETKQKRKKDKGKDADPDKESKDKDKDNGYDDAKDKRERDEAIQLLRNADAAAHVGGSPAVATLAGSEPAAPRVFTLHKNVFGMRVRRIHEAAQAKRSAALLRDKGGLPSVPRGLP